MKKILIICILCCVITTYAQEKRIKFNNGTLKICTSSNMKISGYDGDEVIIKSVTNNNYRVLYNNAAFPQKRRSISATGTATFDRKDKDSVLVNNFRYFVNSNDQKKREKGLKPLGNKSTNPADNLYLDINESPGELVIKDFVHSSGNNNTTVSGRVTTFYHYDKYELLVPNSIKLLWNVENCQKTKAKAFVVRSSSNPWQLSDFSGEVEISSSYSGITLTDVTGPTLVNTIGGNIKVIFDKKTPNKLYSLISKDGYIDVELPSNSNLNIDATGDRILSDLDFKISKDEIVDGLKNMKLQLNNGNVKMKLNSGSGSIYLRKGN